MNYQQNMNLHEQITKAIFKNGLLNHQLLQSEGIIVRLQATISENTNKLKEKMITAEYTRDELKTTIVEKDEKISKLEDDINVMNRQHHELTEHYNKLLENAKGELATLEASQVNECASKDETIHGLHSQLDLMTKNEAKLTEKSDKVIEILEGNLVEKQKQIQENDREFKILNDTIANHVIDKKKIKNDYDQEILKIKVDFEKRLEEHLAEYLKQVTESNTKSNELRDKSNQHSEALTNAVDKM